MELEKGLGMRLKGDFQGKTDLLTLFFTHYIKEEELTKTYV
jgi:hypothetical protein